MTTKVIWIKTLILSYMQLPHICRWTQDLKKFDKKTTMPIKVIWIKTLVLSYMQLSLICTKAQ